MSTNQISKPKPNFINNLNQSYDIKITNIYSDLSYIQPHTNQNRFLNPIILCVIKNNRIYNSKIKYVFNITTNNYELCQYHNNKVNRKTSPFNPTFLLLSIGANSSLIIHALRCDKRHLLMQYRIRYSVYALHGF